jgi:hypothetical protein
MPVSSLPPLHARLCPSICPSHTPCFLSSANLGCSPLHLACELSLGRQPCLSTSPCSTIVSASRCFAYTGELCLDVTLPERILVPFFPLSFPLSPLKFFSCGGIEPTRSRLLVFNANASSSRVEHRCTSYRSENSLPLFCTL